MVHELLPRIFIRSQNEHIVYIFTHVKAIHCSHEGHFVVQKEKERFAVIEINNLVKKYGDHTAVDHLSLVVEPGKIYGFLGPNGAGKSTTMNMITGYLGATSGEIKINGHDILKEPEKAKKCIGYLPELPPLYMDMTVKEYLCFVADLKQLEKVCADGMWKRQWKRPVRQKWQGA